MADKNEPWGNVGAAPAPGKLTVRSSFSRWDGKGAPVTTRLDCDLPAMSLCALQWGVITYNLRRVQRHLALWTGYEVPVEAEVTGKSYFGYHYQSSAAPLTSSQRFELFEEIEGVYQNADLLLRSVPAESLLGKAVENIGATGLDLDVDLKYLHAWNGIELLAKANYLLESPAAVKSGSDDSLPKIPKNAVIVPPLLEEYHPASTLPDIDWIAYLRNGAAHGGFSDYPTKNFEEFVERWDKADALTDLARETLLNFLAVRGIVPRSWMGRPSRVLVGFPDKVDPVDESAKLSLRGITKRMLPKEWSTRLD